MIRQLTRCPYCGASEVALGDQLALVFDPEKEGGGPCPHLAWVDGRYSEWDKGKHGTDHMIGSAEFRWDPPEDGAAERTDALMPYLKEFLNAAPGWPFAPAVPYTIQPLSAEENAATPAGKTQARWEVDGWAVFAEDPAAFWAALPGCWEKLQESLDVGNEFRF